MVRSSIKQNALHTLHHALEHLAWSKQLEHFAEGREFDHEVQTAHGRTPEGHVWFSTQEFTRPPASYNLKFALQHLIQSAELLLKARIAELDRSFLFVDPGSKRTIGFYAALRVLAERGEVSLSPQQAALVVQARDLRNAIEHFEFGFAENELRVLCSDFLAVCVLFAQQLHSINLVDAFAWDSLRDRPDPAMDYLEEALSNLGQAGRISAEAAAAAWRSENSFARLLVCLNCGAKGLGEQEYCVVCGAQGDTEASEAVEDLERLSSLIRRQSH